MSSGKELSSGLFRWLSFLWLLSLCCCVSFVTIINLSCLWCLLIPDLISSPIFPLLCLHLFHVNLSSLPFRSSLIVSSEFFWVRVSPAIHRHLPSMVLYPHWTFTSSLDFGSHAILLLFCLRHNIIDRHSSLDFLSVLANHAWNRLLHLHPLGIISLLTLFRYSCMWSCDSFPSFCNLVVSFLLIASALFVDRLSLH
jgi:hypothetical protein